MKDHPGEEIRRVFHYNNHPSGVECKEIKRHLPSNLADAFKYIFRRNDKGDPLKDMNKALEYLGDQLEHFKEVPPLLHPFAYVELIKVVELEPDPDIAELYMCICFPKSKMDLYRAKFLLGDQIRKLEKVCDIKNRG